MSTHPHRVLLVEDNLTVQKVHLMMLERIGCMVDIADNGHMALHLMENYYDLVLIDIGLPGMSGLEVMIQIRRLEQSGYRPRTPIVTLTAYCDDDARKNCLAAGSDDFIIKPVALSDLSQVVMRWVGK